MLQKTTYENAPHNATSLPAPYTTDMCQGENGLECFTYKECILQQGGKTFFEGMLAIGSSFRFKES